MNPSNEGKTKLSVSKKDNNGARQVNFDGRDNDFVFPVEFFAIGDLKYMFMVVGRSGYSGAHCMHCFLKSADWKKLHKTKKSINLEGEEVTIKTLIDRILRCQQDAGGMKRQKKNC